MGTDEVQTLVSPFQPLPRSFGGSLSARTLCHTPRFVICLVLSFACFSRIVEAGSYDFSYGDGANQGNWRITCYTCMNVSNNEECNRYAIDRPCPEGKDYCLTLHVMEGLDEDRSVLVNKRCAPFEDCVGDSTGCATAYGQTQCVSCCDQPYCNDFVPINDTNAIFQRSTARGTVVFRTDSWRVAVLFAVALTTVFTLSGTPCVL